MHLLKHWPRLVFYAAGLLTTALCGWLVANWLDVASSVFGLAVSYDTRPTWLRLLMTAVTWLPLATLAVLIVVRVVKGQAARPLAFAAGAATAYLLAVGTLILGPSVDEYRNRRVFDPSAWKHNDRRDVDWPARLTMVNDLLARYPLRGLGRDSVEQLLGPRDATDYFHDWDLVYWLGPERGLFRIDSEWLVVRFGSDGRVSDYRVVRD